MKIRSDFVSNSSSSSFICLLSDNKYGILLDKFKILDLRAFLNEFGWRDLFDFNFDYRDDAESIVKYVSSQAFSKKFGQGAVENTLPKTAKLAYEEYNNALKKRKEMEQSKGIDFYTGKDENANSLLEMIDQLQSKVLDKVYEALEPEWGKEKFCYLEVDDNMSFDDDECNDFDCMSNEEKTEERFKYVCTLKPLKFWRVFNNH